MTTWQERFNTKFNHFNDLYLGRHLSHPLAGKQIDNWDCSKKYDLSDVEAFISKERLHAVEEYKQSQLERRYTERERQS